MRLLVKGKTMKTDNPTNPKQTVPRFSCMIPPLSPTEKEELRQRIADKIEEGKSYGTADIQSEYRLVLLFLRFLVVPLHPGIWKRLFQRRTDNG
jgi:hypothetical protein